MADDSYAGLLNVTSQYYVHERDVMPEVGNVYYTNTEYYSSLGFKGYNKFAARRPSSTGGWVLPNCTGYSYGRVLETCGLDHCDYIVGDASQWFDYNKNLFDNGKGGYPYIQLKASDMGFNIGSGFQATNSANVLYKLILSLCRPGNVVCYGEGTSSVNGGMVFGEEGHVQTLERLWADEKALEEYNRNLKTGGVVAALIAAILGIQITATLAPMLASAATSFLQYLQLWAAGKAGGLTLIEHLLEGYVAAGLITEENKFNVLDDLTRVVVSEDGHWVFEYIKGSELGFLKNATSQLPTIGALILLLAALGLGTVAVVSAMLEGAEFSGLPTLTITQSSANGYSSESTIGLWHQDRIDFNNAIGTIEGDPTLQGIIITPCQEPPLFARRGSFPWQLGNNIGLYD